MHAWNLVATFALAVATFALARRVCHCSWRSAVTASTEILLYNPQVSAPEGKQGPHVGSRLSRAAETVTSFVTNMRMCS